jgi:hypothetical protein
VPGGRNINAYFMSDNSQHVNYIDAGGHIHELYCGPGTCWKDNDLTIATPAPAPTPAKWGSPVTSYAMSDGTQHVFYIDVNGHVREIYYLPGTGWRANDLGGVPYWSLHAYWGSENGNLGEHVNTSMRPGACTSSTAGRGACWTDNNLTSASGAGAASSFSAVPGFQTRDQSQHVYYVDTSLNLHELVQNPGAGWRASAFLSPSAGSYLLAAYPGPDGSRHTDYVTGSAQVEEAYAP